MKESVPMVSGVVETNGKSRFECIITDILRAPNYKEWMSKRLILVLDQKC